MVCGGRCGAGRGEGATNVAGGARDKDFGHFGGVFFLIFIHFLFCFFLFTFITFVWRRERREEGLE